MINFNLNTKIFLVCQGVDMRKQFDSLWLVAKNEMGLDPLEGGVFVFANAARSRCKILFWDGTGTWVCAKRLVKGTFSWPQNVRENQRFIRLENSALTLLLDGVDMRDAARRPWYQRE